jgi:hypothetical protein
VEVRTRRVFAGRLAGSTCLMEENSSARVVDAGKGRHSVGGSDRPGKESNKILTTGSMLQQPRGTGVDLCMEYGVRSILYLAPRCRGVIEVQCGNSLIDEYSVLCRSRDKEKCSGSSRCSRVGEFVGETTFVERKCFVA